MIPGRHSINIDLYFQRYNQDHLNCQSRQRCALYMSLQLCWGVVGVGAGMAQYKLATSAI